MRIAETALNELLSRTSTTAPSLQVQPQNVVMVRYGLFHASVELPRIVEPNTSGEIRFRLASVLVALALRTFLHQPFVQVDGRHVTINLGALPLRGKWRDLWKHLHQLTFETEPGALRVGFAVEIADHDDSPEEGATVTAPNSMREWFENQLAAGLPAFAGSTISGTLALKQELLNEWLSRFLAQGEVPAAPPADFARLKRFIKTASVRAEAGQVLLDFHLSI